MRLLFAAAAAALAGLAAPASAQGPKGTEVELGGMKATAPAGWKADPLPPGSMRMHTFKLPKADGDPEDAELAVFFFRGGSGTVEQNLARQVAKFQPAPGAAKVESKVEKTKVGSVDATYQDVSGTFLKKFPPFAPDAKITRMDSYRQLYVVFETKDGQYYMTLLGPTKTVEKHKKDFEGWLKSFK